MTTLAVPEYLAKWVEEAQAQIASHAEVVGPLSFSDTDAERGEWLKRRKSGIGGSDAATALGLSPWDSPFSLWVDKTTDTISESDNEYMRWGRRLEEPIGRGIAEDTSILVSRYPWMLRSKEWPWMQVSLDFIAPQSVVEVKNVGSRMAHEWKDGQVPDHYLMQGQHACAVTGLPGVYFFALIGGNESRPVYVERDEALIENLVEGERKFWELVQTMTPPAIDNSEHTRDALKRLYADPDHESVLKLTEQQALDMSMLIEARREYKELEKQNKQWAEEVESQIFAIMGNYEVATHDGITICTWKKVDRKSYYVEPNSYRRINIPKKKEMK
jgi:putative phage-type endonuclease